MGVFFVYNFFAFHRKKIWGIPSDSRSAPPCVIFEYPVISYNYLRMRYGDVLGVGKVLGENACAEGYADPDRNLCGRKTAVDKNGDCIIYYEILRH